MMAYSNTRCSVDDRKNVISFSIASQAFTGVEAVVQRQFMNCPTTYYSHSRKVKNYWNLDYRKSQGAETLLTIVCPCIEFYDKLFLPKSAIRSLKDNPGQINLAKLGRKKLFNVSGFPN